MTATNVIFSLQFIVELLLTGTKQVAQATIDQAIVGTLLYYGRAVNSTILPSLSSLATEQAKPIAKTKATVMQ